MLEVDIDQEQNARGKPQCCALISTNVLVGSHVYISLDRVLAKSFDAKTGFVTGQSVLQYLGINTFNQRLCLRSHRGLVFS